MQDHLFNCERCKKDFFCYGYRYDGWIAGATGKPKLCNDCEETVINFRYDCYCGVEHKDCACHIEECAVCGGEVAFPKDRKLKTLE